MRISDWSSDVCSSDLVLSEQVRGDPRLDAEHQLLALFFRLHRLGRELRDVRDEGDFGRDRVLRGGVEHEPGLGPARKSVVWGKSVSVRVDLGGRRIIKTKRNTREKNMGVHKTQ